MAPHRRTPWHVGAAAFALFALVAASCSKSSGSPPPPEVHGILGFDERTARAAFVPPIAKQAFFACGSNTEAWETLFGNGTPPNKWPDPVEWGDIVPGEQVYAEGSVTGLNSEPGETQSFFAGDLPPTHPFGRDITYNLQLDPPFTRLAMKLGTASTDIPAGSIHTEIPIGRLPHDSAGNVLDGFTPQDGDRTAVYGHWILDCGHPDFHSEVHPPSFMSFARQDGNTTVVHAFADPYYEDQLFNPDPSLSNALSNTTRFSDPNTVPFPTALFNDILEIAGIKQPPANRLEAHELISANETSPVTWYACAASGSGKLTYDYHFTVRPGVSIKATPMDDIGCVQFTATIGSSYTPATPQRQDCAVPWDLLSAQAGTDVRAGILKQVPASIAPQIKKNPVVDCYTSLVAPALATGSGKTVTPIAGQPFPFYGEIEVSRG